MRRYQSALDLAPSSPTVLAGVFGVVVLAVLAIVVAERGLPTWAPWLILLPAFVGVGLALRRAIHSEVALWLEHYSVFRQARAMTEAVRYADLHDRMLEKTLRLISAITLMSPEQLDVLSRLPLSELELMPGAGEFLVLPPGERVGTHSIRVPMLIVDEIVVAWRDRVDKGSSPYHLPPLRFWSDSRRRDFVRLIYAGLADASLVHIRSTGSWSAGNATAVIAQDVGPEFVLSWLRSDEDIEIVKNDAGRE